MEGPGALTLEYTGSRSDAVIAAGLGCVVAACIAGLAVAGSLRTLQHSVAAVALMLASFGPSLYLMRRSGIAASHGVLRWDGQGWLWSWEHADSACPVGLMLDLHHVMLLQVGLPDGERQWLWLWRKAHAKNWFALRRALIFSASTTSKPTESGLSWQGV